MINLLNVTQQNAKLAFHIITTLNNALDSNKIEIYHSNEN